MKSMRDEEVEIIHCLIDRVDNARALSPSDVGSLLYDISEGEYVIPLKWICEAIDKHDSLPSQGELEALRNLGSQLDIDVDSFFRYLDRPDETIPEEYLVWTDWECQNILLPEGWTQEDADAFIPTMIRFALLRNECTRLTGGSWGRWPRNGTPPLHWIIAYPEHMEIDIVADLHHRRVVTRNRMFLADTPYERRARHLLLQAAKIPDLEYRDFAPVLKLIGAGEWEVALTVLCTQLCETRAPLGTDDLAAIHAAGEHLRIDTGALLTPASFLTKRIRSKKIP